MNNALTRKMVEERIDKKGHLSLKSMDIKEVPAWIVDYPICELDLTFNSIEFLPENIGDMKKLEVLNINYNWPIEKLPDSICDIITLKCICAVSNLLKELPIHIGKLKNLIYLGIKFSQIEFLPESICELSALKYLDLAQNKLTRLPDNIWKLKNLSELNVSSNNIDVLPDRIGEIESLKKIYVCGNPIKVLPDSFAHLNRLEELDITGTRIRELAIPCGLKRLINKTGE